MFGPSVVVFFRIYNIYDVIPNTIVYIILYMYICRTRRGSRSVAGDGTGTDLIDRNAAAREIVDESEINIIIAWRLAIDGGEGREGFPIFL